MGLETEYRTNELTTGSTYEFSVIAVNAIGQSEPSTAIEIKQAAKPTRPAPVSLDFNRETRQITINWEAP